jgi:hypothetical protein
MSAKTLLILSASLLLGAVIAAPSAALAQFGPPPVLRPCSPVLLRVLVPGVLLRVSLAVPHSAVPRVFRPVAAPAHLRAILPVLRVV